MKKKCKINNCCNEVRYKKLQLCQKHYMIKYKKDKDNNFKSGFKLKICFICNNSFKPNSPNAKYCSINCKRIGRNNTNNILRKRKFFYKLCEFCNKNFKTTRNFQKVCIDCRKEFINKKKKLYYYNVLKPKFGYLNRGKSFPQFFIYNILIQKFDNLNWTYNDRSIIKNPKTNYPLELDIYCKEKNFAIEFDGEHHFSSKQFGLKKYLKVKELDNIKDEQCKNNNIVLLRLSYKDKWKEKEWIIQNVGEFVNVNYQMC